MAPIVNASGHARNHTCLRETLDHSIKQEPKQMPELVDDRRQAAFRRMDDMFPTNRGLKPNFELLANAHRYAIDYIVQAPVIVLAVTHGRAYLLRSERAFLQEQLSSMCESGAQLREVMRA